MQAGEISRAKALRLEGAAPFGGRRACEAARVQELEERGGVASHGGAEPLCGLDFILGVTGAAVMSFFQKNLYGVSGPAVGRAESLPSRS